MMTQTSEPVGASAADLMDSLVAYAASLNRLIDLLVGVGRIPSVSYLAWRDSQPAGKAVGALPCNSIGGVGGPIQPQMSAGPIPGFAPTQDVEEDSWQSAENQEWIL
jgi:hypothetical protein